MNAIKFKPLHPKFSLHESVREFITILGYSYASIDLIFTSQPNLILDSGVNACLHPNCHYQVLFAKFDFQVYCPPPHGRQVWNCK